MLRKWKFLYLSTKYKRNILWKYKYRLTVEFLTCMTQRAQAEYISPSRTTDSTLLNSQSPGKRKKT